MNDGFVSYNVLIQEVVGLKESLTGLRNALSAACKARKPYSIFAVLVHNRSERLRRGVESIRREYD